MKISKLNVLLLVVGAVLLGALTTSMIVKTNNNTKSDGGLAIPTNEDGESYNVPPTYYSVKLPSSMNFAGEAVPLHINDVKERLEREMLVTAYRHSNTFLMLKRKERWFPIIERILAEEGVPDDFKYLCVAESGMANVTSPAGAKGFWQFLSGTAKQYGLEVNKEVDERYHVEKATRAACQYLKESKNRFGSWTAAAASYNMGRGGVSNQMTRQGESDYYDLLLNQETSRYLFRILAFKEVLSNPTQYGFHVDYNDTYRPYEYTTVTVNSSVPDFAQFAKQHGTNYKLLKIYNPWLRDKELTVKYNTYEVKIPR